MSNNVKLPVNRETCLKSLEYIIQRTSPLAIKVFSRKNAQSVMSSDYYYEISRWKNRAPPGAAPPEQSGFLRRMKLIFQQDVRFSRAVFYARPKGRITKLRGTRGGLDKGLSSSGERRVGTGLDCSAQEELQGERNEVDRGGRIQLYPPTIGLVHQRARLNLNGQKGEAGAPNIPRVHEISPRDEQCLIELSAGCHYVLDLSYHDISRWSIGERETNLILHLIDLASVYLHPLTRPSLVEIKFPTTSLFQFIGTNIF